MIEEWKPIKDYIGYYEVSTLGRIRSVNRYVKNGVSGYLRKGKILKPSTHLNGYLFVRLCKNGVYKYFSVHRLVALNFIKQPNINLDVNHKDGNKINNHVDNLEWITRSENVLHALDNGLANRKSISAPIRCINIKTKQQMYFKSMREAERNGFSQSSISSCINGKQKTHKGFKWYLQ